MKNSTLPETPRARPKRRLSSLAAALAFAAGLGTGTEARAQAEVAVRVDGIAAGAPLKAIWPYFGYDELNYTTTARGRALLASLAATQADPVYVRTHFMLNTGDGTAALKWGSTNVYTEDAGGNPVYDWSRLDGITDAMIGAGTFPLVEIGFMPQALSRHPNPYQNSNIYALDSGCFYPPSDYTKWAALIRAFATHVAGRYPGMENDWQWELWNEPDIAYWKGTFAEFATLFDHTEAALHSVLPNTSLGGPSILNPNGTFLRDFLQHCAAGRNAVSGQTGTRLDMISFHAKGGVALSGGNVRMNLGNQLRLHRAGFTTIAGFPQYRQTPIVISEADPDGCAACTSTRVAAAAYRNSTAYGAYEVAMMKRTLELEAALGVNVRGLVTWAFLFENTPYFAGYRVLESNGIHMPVLNAFKLLGKLAGNRVPATSSGARTLDDVLTNSVRQQPDIDVMATRNGRQIQALVWNYHDDLVNSAPTPVTLSVNVPADFGPRVALTHLRVDQAHGDAYTVWVSQGSPATPSSAQRAALERAMEPAPLEPERVVDAMGGVVSVAFDLPRFGISLVTLTGSGPSGGAGGMGGTGGASGASGGGGDAGGGGTVSGGAAGTAGSAGTLGAGGIAGAGGAAGSNGAASGSGGTQLSTGGMASAGTPYGAGAGMGARAASGSSHDGGCACSLSARTPSIPSAMMAALGLLLVLRGTSRKPRAQSSPNQKLVQS